MYDRLRDWLATMIGGVLARLFAIKRAPNDSDGDGQIG